MKVLLIGECYSENLGDGVICDTVAEIIKEKYENVTITYFDLSGRLDYNTYAEPKLESQKFKWFCRFAYRLPFLVNWHPFYHAYKKDEYRYIRAMSTLKKVMQEKYDIAVFAGGSIFMDYFAGILYYVVRELNRRKVPIIFHACGLSCLDDESRYLLKKTLSRKYVLSISLRDSEEKFMQFFPGIEYCSTYDTAFNCSKYFKKNINPEFDIGIGVISLPNCYDYQKELIRYLLNTKFSWRIFTNGSPGDYNTAVNILWELGIDEDSMKKYLINRPITPKDLITTITGFKKIISFRMHSQIIASSYDIETYGLIWDDKIIYMYEKLGFPECCCYPLKVPDDYDVILKHQIGIEKLHNNVEFIAEQSRRNLYAQLNNIIREV